LSKVKVEPFQSNRFDAVTQQRRLAQVVRVDELTSGVGCGAFGPIQVDAAVPRKVRVQRNAEQAPVGSGVDRQVQCGHALDHSADDPLYLP